MKKDVVMRNLINPLLSIILAFSFIVCGHEKVEAASCIPTQKGEFNLVEPSKEGGVIRFENLELNTCSNPQSVNVQRYLNGNTRESEAVLLPGGQSSTIWSETSLTATASSHPLVFNVGNASLGSNLSVSQESSPTCSGSWAVWGLSGVSSRYEPGASLGGSLSYKIGNNSDSPGALAQVLVGIIDSSGKAYDVTCIYDGNPRTCPDNTSGTGSFKLTVPDSPGSYRLVAAMDRHYACSNARSNFPRQGDKETLATIEVGSKEATKYTLTIEDRIADKLLKSSTFTYNAGETATITANSYDNYKFDHWGGAASGSNSKTNVTMDSNKTVIAYFKESKNEDITLTIEVVGNGTTDPAAGIHSYKKGDKVTIIAVPPKDGGFIEWKGDKSSKSKYITLTMDSSKETTAYFITSNDGDGDEEASTFFWSDCWWTKRTSTGREGPENNIFKAKNVWVDKQDNTLHLKIAKESNGHWTSAEVFTSDKNGTEVPLGFGGYEFELLGNINNIDRGVVIGLFNYTGWKEDKTNEIDVEIGNFEPGWWLPWAKPRIYYTVYPAVRGEKKWSQPFDFEKGRYYSNTKHVFSWTKTGVGFESSLLSGSRITPLFTSLFNPIKNSNKLIPQKPLPVHINLWLREGKAPSNGEEKEIVIKSFKFKENDSRSATIKTTDAATIICYSAEMQESDLNVFMEGGIKKAVGLIPKEIIKKTLGVVASRIFGFVSAFISIVPSSDGAKVKLKLLSETGSLYPSLNIRPKGKEDLFPVISVHCGPSMDTFNLKVVKINERYPTLNKEIWINKIDLDQYRKEGYGDFLIIFNKPLQLDETNKYKIVAAYAEGSDDLTIESWRKE